jgi:hypothetical protein
VLVISHNFVRRPVGYHRQLAPASTDCDHVFQESGFAALIINPAEPLLESSLRRDLNRLAGELRQTPRQTLGLGILDAQSHVRESQGDLFNPLISKAYARSYVDWVKRIRPLHRYTIAICLRLWR